MKNNPFTGKSTRTKIFTVITVASIILLFALNLFITSFGIFGNAYIDLTPEGLYTLRDRMVDACEGVFNNPDGTPREPGITITFCDDPDNLIENTLTRTIYYMAVALSHKFDNCDVKTVNVEMNPTAVAQYKTTSLTKIDSDDVIVSYGQRYSITSAEKFWHLGSDNVVYAFDGEYKLASILLSLTLVNRPVAYFVTDHKTTTYFNDDLEGSVNEELGDFVDLLRERGLEVKNLSIAEDVIKKAEEESKKTGKRVDPSIPEDCVLLIINNPREDFDCDADKLGTYSYVSETEILDRYMTESRGSIMVTMDYRGDENGKNMTNFEDFLAEWGIKCTDTRVEDSLNHIKNEDGTETTVIADYELSEDSYANSIYGDFAAIETSPRVVVSDTGTIVSAFGEPVEINEPGSSKTSRIFAPFLYTSKDAVSKSLYKGDYTATNAIGKQVIAAVGGRQTIDENTGENTYSYVFCAASRDFLTNDLIGNASYANYDVVSALVQNIARLETHADSYLGGLSMNNDDNTFGGKMLLDTSIREADEYITDFNEDGNPIVVDVEHGMTTGAVITFTCIILAIPVAIAVLGIIICLKRRFL